MNPIESVNNESFNILPWIFEERVYTFINDLKHPKESFKDVEFHLMDRECEQYKHKWPGFTSYDEETNSWFITINPDLKTEAGFVVCHEIEHIELRFSGFNFFVKPKNKEDKHFNQWEYLGTAIQNTFSDCLVNKKLERDYGFSLISFGQHLYNSIQESLDNFPKTPANQVEGIAIPMWFTLKLASTHLYPKPTEIVQLEVNIRKNPFLKDCLKVGKLMYDNLLSTDFNNPTAFKECIIKVIKSFRISDYLTIYEL